MRFIYAERSLLASGYLSSLQQRRFLRRRYMADKQYPDPAQYHRPRYCQKRVLARLISAHSWPVCPIRTMRAYITTVIPAIVHAIPNFRRHAGTSKICEYTTAVQACRTTEWLRSWSYHGASLSLGKKIVVTKQ